MRRKEESEVPRDSIVRRACSFELREMQLKLPPFVLVALERQHRLHSDLMEQDHVNGSGLLERVRNGAADRFLPAENLPHNLDCANRTFIECIEQHVFRVVARSDRGEKVCDDIPGGDPAKRRETALIDFGQFSARDARPDDGRDQGFKINGYDLAPHATPSLLKEVPPFFQEDVGDIWKIFARCDRAQKGDALLPDPVPLGCRPGEGGFMARREWRDAHPLLDRSERNLIEVDVALLDDALNEAEVLALSCGEALQLLRKRRAIKERAKAPPGDSVLVAVELH